MSAWLIILAAVALLVLWIRLVPTFFRLRTDRPLPLLVATPDGWTLSVWYRPARERRFVEPIVLCHGLANNHALLEFQPPSSLAAFLSEAGFDCYTVDLRGAGLSQPAEWGPWDATVDDHIRLDAPAVIEFVRLHARAERVIWVGHSLGGLIGLAAASSTAVGRIAALVTIGSPVFFRYRHRVDLMLRVGRWLATAGRFPMDWLAGAVTPFAGWVNGFKPANASANLANIGGPAQRLVMANAFAPIWRGVLDQFEGWVSRDEFRSLDGTVDYREGVRGLTLPLLLCGGSVDMLAPPSSQRRYFEHLTTADRQLAMFGKKYGHADDYGHGDLLVGTRASTEVYPVIREWLERRATPVGPQGPRSIQSEAGRATAETS